MKILREDRKEQQWPALRLFSIYRLIVSSIFFTLSIFGTYINFLVSLNPSLSSLISSLYVIFAIIALICTYFRWVPYKIQVYIAIIVDIIAITLLMHFYGGVSSGFGTLMIAVIAGGSLLLPGKSALLFAALATLAILTHEIYASLHPLFDNSAYTQAGLLGAALFATALLAITMAQRASESERLAAKRGIDLANLAKLNEHLINRMDSGIMVIDDDGTIRMANHAAWVLLNKPDILNQSKLIEISAPLYDLYKSWRKVNNNTEFRNHLEKLKRDNASDLQVRFTPVGSRKHDKGSVVYLSDNKDIEKQVQETKLASLGRLTASIAHEIRNPLGAISHAAQLLDESNALDQADKRLATIIQDQSVRLNNIINNILRLSRGEKAKPENLELRPWLTKFIDEFCSNNDVNKNSISIRISPPKATVYIDPNHLHQILWNICKNAKKYGKTNQSQLKIQFIAKIDENNSSSNLDIIDQGPGVKKEHETQLFEPFFTTSDSGTGLGLYLSRELCKNNGGDLRYIRHEEIGSCFRIEFPHKLD